MTSRHIFAITTLIPAFTLALAPPVSAQGVLTLTEALERADRQAYGNRAAVAAADAQSAEALRPLQGILPTLRAEAGYVSTTDPIGAFGTTLRQRRVTPADFDPQKLNHPEIARNYGAALVVEQPLFNADAHLGRRAATRAAAASKASAEWARSTTRLDVVRAYYGVVLAAERVRTLEVAVRAAQGHVRQAESMVRNGLVTRSDALLAEVKAGEVDAELIAARGDAELAGKHLAVLLGEPTSTNFELPERLPTLAGDPLISKAATVDSPVARSESRSRAAEVGARGDVRAARLGLEAARADAQRARSLYLPRLNAFARYDWNSANRLFGGDKNWSAGLMVSWSPFAGASEIGEWRAAAARARAARAQAEAAEAMARLEVEQAERALQVALARLEIAERAVAQSEEAHRIVTRKYEGGLATVTELLDAAAIDTQTRLGRIHAQYEVITATAALLHSRGRDLTELVDLLATP